MYWSIYDTLMLVTGILTAGLGMLPVAGIPQRTRGIALAAGSVLIVVSIVTGNMQSFTYPSQVYFGPVIPIIAAARVLFLARRARGKAERDSPDAAGLDEPAEAAPAAPGEEPISRGILAPVSTPDLMRLPERVEEQSPAERASDPATGAEALADLAYQHPDLRAAVAANPSAYPELREWIAAAGLQAAPGVTAQTGAMHPSNALTPSTKRAMAVIGVVLVAAIVLGSGVSFAASGGLATLVSNIANGRFGANGFANPETGSGPSAAEEAAATANASDAAGGADGSTATPVVAPPRYVPTVLILDASGSMIRDAPGGGTRMEAARAAATTFVNGLSEGAQLGLTVFGTKTGNADSDQPAGCTDVTTVIPVGRVDKPGFSAAIAGIVQSGFTPIGLALQRAADQLPTDEPATIVLVSDGVDSCSPPPSCEIAAALKQSHPELTIHTVGFLVDADEEALAQLSCIAQAGGGEFVEAANAAQLAARLRIASDPVATSASLNSSGINGLRLGMTLAQARAAEPGLSGTRTVNEYVYVDCPYATLRFANGVVDEIRPQESASTAEGLTAGDTLATAIDLYGPATDMQTNDLGDFAQFAATPGGTSGYRVFYTPTENSLPSWAVLRIVLCTCGLKTGGASVASTWVIDFNGIGPIHMGQSFTDAFTAVPERAHIWPDYCTNVASLDIPTPSGELTVAGQQSDTSRTIDTISLTDLDGGMVSTQLPRTWAGVGFGSTLDQVRAAHPGLSLVYWQKAAADYWIITGANGNSLIFHPDDAGRVSTITLTAVPRPIYELCG